MKNRKSDAFPAPLRNRVGLSSGQRRQHETLKPPLLASTFGRPSERREVQLYQGKGCERISGVDPIQPYCAGEDSLVSCVLRKRNAFCFYSKKRDTHARAKQAWTTDPSTPPFNQFPPHRSRHIQQQTNYSHTTGTHFFLQLFIHQIARRRTITPSLVQCPPDRRSGRRKPPEFA